MAFFKTNDHERELLSAFYMKKGLSGEQLEEAILTAKGRLEEGMPLAYITGEEAFYDLVFEVNEDVLIPRPDTERLVEKAIGLLPQGGRFCDLGTGSGCIAVTLAKHRPDAFGMALDLSLKALAVAKRNAEANGVASQIVFCHKDMKEGLCEDERFDLILSNPPYIPKNDIAAYPSLAYEPIMALDGGEDGMDFYRSILDKYKGNLKPDGGFLFEIGFDQRDAISSLAASLGFTCQVEKDYGNNDRLAIVFPKA